MTAAPIPLAVTNLSVFLDCCQKIVSGIIFFWNKCKISLEHTYHFRIRTYWRPRASLLPLKSDFVSGGSLVWRKNILDKGIASTSPEVEIYPFKEQNEWGGESREMKLEDGNQVMEGFVGPCKVLVFCSEGQRNMKGFWAEGWCGPSVVKGSLWLSLKIQGKHRTKGQ